MAASPKERCPGAAEPLNSPERHRESPRPNAGSTRYEPRLSRSADSLGSSPLGRCAAPAAPDPSGRAARRERGLQDAHPAYASAGDVRAHAAEWSWACLSVSAGGLAGGRLRLEVLRHQAADPFRLLDVHRAELRHRLLQVDDRGAGDRVEAHHRQFAAVAGLDGAARYPDAVGSTGAAAGEDTNGRGTRMRAMTVSKAGASPVWPAVTAKARGGVPSSAARGTLVLSPPWERPGA